MKSFFPILQLKIAVGYILLLFLLCTVVFLVRLEHGKMEELDSKEYQSNMRRRAVNRTFEKLLEFSFHEHFLLTQNSVGIHEYRNSCMVALDALNGLRLYYTTELYFAIDTISKLLLEKERLHHEVTNTLSRFPRADSLLHKKVSGIMRQTQGFEQPTAQQTKKAGNLFRFFSKDKNKKSAYASRKEKEMQGLKSKSSMSGQFIRLQKDVYNQYADYRKRLASYSDSLQCRNRELNMRISGLMHELERMADTQYAADMKETTALRKQSFRIILFIAVISILLIILLYLLIHTDIRKRQKHRMALETACSRNEELLMSRRNLMLSVSHDLRAPLGTVCEFAELMQHEKDTGLVREFAANILHASRHVIGLANNLLHYYRLEEGKEQPENVVFHLGEIIGNTVRTYLPSAQKKGLGLTTEIKSCDVLVRSDSGRIVQILGNLLSNAIKFTRVGYIHVGALYQTGRLSLFVRDTGTGIDKGRQQLIFSDFEQIGSPMGDGFGLGLAVTSRLVSLLGGDIRVESMPGRGSTFEIRLPLDEADMQDIQDSASVGSILPDIRVLYIDDDRIQLDAVRRMYLRHGIECDCCTDIDEMVTAFRKNRYDLVLTDMRMPDTDGYSVLALLRNSNIGQSGTVPVLAVTARVDNGAVHFINSGFAGCLHKPFSEEELLAVTRSVERPDFTYIMEGEEHVDELLDIFIEDTEAGLVGIRDAVSSGDYARLGNIIHKAVPIWETIRIDIPLQELAYMGSLSPEKWADISEGRIERLARAVEDAVRKAVTLKEKMNGDNTHCGG